MDTSTSQPAARLSRTTPVPRSASLHGRFSFRWLLSRWPTLGAVGVVAASFGMSADVARPLLTILPLLYVLAVVVGHRRASWPLLVGCVGLFVSLRSLHPDTQTVVILLAAGVAGVVGLTWRRSKESALQLAGYAAIAGVVSVSLLAPASIAVPVLAIGWAGHGVWDFWHLRRDRVVQRSFAEWCGVLDILLAAGILLWA